MIPSNHRLAERRLIRVVLEGRWEIDDDGRIWKVATMRRGRLRPCARRRVERFIPSKRNPEDGYLMVVASIDGHTVSGLAHRLVWQHLHGDIPEGLTINHEDGCKRNNKPTNLTLATYTEQQRHARHVLGHFREQRGERNHATKLTDAQVSEIRELYAAGGVTMLQLGHRYGVRFQQISRIVRGDRRATQAGPVSRHDHRHVSTPRDLQTGRFVPGTECT